MGSGGSKEYKIFSYFKERDHSKVEKFLENYAAPDYFRVFKEFNTSFFQFAVSNKQLSLVKMMVERMEEYESDIRNTNSLKHEIKTVKDGLNQANSNGIRAIHLASEIGAIKIMKYLNEKGADLNAVDNFGFSALHSASIHGFKEIFDYLLDHGVKITVDNNGNTPLHFLASYGKYDSIKSILNRADQHGWNTISETDHIHSKNNGGKTPADMALNHEYTVTAKYLFLHQLEMKNPNPSWSASFVEYLKFQETFFLTLNYHNNYVDYDVYPL